MATELVSDGEIDLLAKVRNKRTALSGFHFNHSNVFMLSGGISKRFQIDERVLFDRNSGEEKAFQIGERAWTSEEDSDENYLLETSPVKTQPERRRNSKTWIFDSLQTDETGKLTITKQLPKTVTSWTLTGFALNEHGLVSAKPQKLVVKKSFFVKVHVPETIQVGEILKVEILIYNFLNSEYQNLQAEVTISKDSEEMFDFVKRTKRCQYEPEEVNEVSRIVNLSNSSLTNTSIYINPKTSGELSFKVKVICREENVSDEIEAQLIVEDADNWYFEDSILIDLSKLRYQRNKFEMNLKTNVRKNSVKAGASLHFKLLGPKLLNVNNLM